MHHLKCNLNEYERKEDEILNNFENYYEKNRERYRNSFVEIYKTDIKSIFEKRKWTESGLAWIFIQICQKCRK